MQFTVFSFVTSWVFSAVILLTIHFLRRNREFIKSFGVGAMLLLYIGCIVRMAFTPEFSFTRSLELPRLVNSFYQAIYIEPITVFTHQISIYVIFLGVWLLVAALLTAVFALRYLFGLREISQYEANTSRQGERILHRVRSEHSRKIQAKVFICPKVKFPMGVGLKKKRILLPAGEYTDQELYYMLKHEYAHFYNRDLTVTFLVNLFCCLYWWNPAVYLLRKDISQMLELKCDLTVTQQFSLKEKTEYCSIILELLKGPKPKNAIDIPAAAGMAKRAKSSALVERFDAVLKPFQKGKRWISGSVLVGFLAVFLMSYTVVIQPYYDPPKKEVMSTDGTIDPDPSEGYILKRSDGTYLMVLPDQTFPLSQETAEVFASTGIEIKEETK